MVATFRYTDASSPEGGGGRVREAGGGGFASSDHRAHHTRSSSYINAVACRDRDANSGWASAADSTMEERVYYLQNWRADVVAISDTAGDILEWVKYSSYGVPICIPKGDYDTDGDVDAGDVTFLDSAINGGTGWWRDFNRDGAENGSDTGDLDTYRTGYSGGTGGRDVLSRSGIANRIGYAGYQWDPAISADHVRHRVYRPEMGRWTRRDPLAHAGDANLVSAFNSSPMVYRDPAGLRNELCFNDDPQDQSDGGLWCQSRCKSRRGGDDVLGEAECRLNYCCVCERTIRRQVRSPLAQDALIACTMWHEVGHLQRCGSKQNSYCQHADIYRAEIQCLMQFWSQCPDNDVACRDEIWREVENDMQELQDNQIMCDRLAVS